MPPNLPAFDRSAAEIPPPLAYRRLSTLGPLGLRREACLHLHKPFLDCHRCAEACPRGCLKLTDGGIDFDPTACTGCGQCAAQCPSEALAVDGFAYGGATTGTPLQIVCRKYEGGIDAGEVWRVPCLGGLDSVALVSIVERRQAPLRLRDDGACARCADARGDNPVRPALAHANALLQSVAVPVAWLPGIESSSPNGNRAVQAEKKAQGPAGRRAFFSGLGRAASAAVVKKAGAAEAVLDFAALPRQPRAAIPYQRGHRLQRSLARLAQARRPEGTALAWRAELTAGGDCQAHGSCARLCPTGALALQHDAATSRLSFDPGLCIDCGACRNACPSQALSYQPPAWRPALGGRRQEILQTAMHECGRCGARSASGAGDLCPTCRKTQALAGAGFALVGMLRQARPEAVRPP